MKGSPLGNRERLLTILLFFLLASPVLGASDSAILEVSCRVVPSELISGEDGQVKVTVTFEGRPVPDAEVTLSSSFLQISQKAGITDSEGNFRATLSAPAGLSGTDRLTARAIYASRSTKRMEAELTGSESIEVVVKQPLVSKNQPPIADASASPTIGVAPLTVTFNGRNSYDPEGAKITFSWNFADGQTGNGPEITHTFADAGTYRTMLIVTDAGGLSSSPFYQEIRVDAFLEVGDMDHDGINNVVDNCRLVYNPDQRDGEFVKHDPIVQGGAPFIEYTPDGVGDVCDNCPGVVNKYQVDSDKDSVGDACDRCPDISLLHDDRIDDNQDQIPDCLQDDDRDLVPDWKDNCRDNPNNDQTDGDTDGVGDKCDNCLISSNSDQNDTDGDKTGDACDCDDGIQGPLEEAWDCGGPCGGEPCDLCNAPNLPSSFDYRNYRSRNWISAVGDQGTCGACWSFAASGVVEAMFMLEHPDLMMAPSNPLNLSAQMLVTERLGGGDCFESGKPSKALFEIQNRGIFTEECFPFRSGGCVVSYRDGPQQPPPLNPSVPGLESAQNPETKTWSYSYCRQVCWHNPSSIERGDSYCVRPDVLNLDTGCQITRYCIDQVERVPVYPVIVNDIRQVENIPPDHPKVIELIKRALVCHGPLAVGSKKQVHAFRLIGWNDTAVHPNWTVSQGGTGKPGYWLYQNSWGAAWGPWGDGYSGKPYDHPHADFVYDAWYVKGVRVC